MIAKPFRPIDWCCLAVWHQIVQVWKFAVQSGLTIVSGFLLFTIWACCVLVVLDMTLKRIIIIYYSLTILRSVISISQCWFLGQRRRTSGWAVPSLFISCQSYVPLLVSKFVFVFPLFYLTRRRESILKYKFSKFIEKILNGEKEKIKNRFYNCSMNQAWSRFV